ncbi:MAG: hypothetical protein ACREQ9_13635 [Candidatus Binatia bacterium]
MILDTISSSLAAVAALGIPERIAAAGAFVVYVCAIVLLRRLGASRVIADRRDEEPEARDAA